PRGARGANGAGAAERKPPPADPRCDGRGRLGAPMRSAEPAPSAPRKPASRPGEAEGAGAICR
ncbi:hypothetical protein EG858_15925, partial [Enterococcus faecalis]